MPAKSADPKRPGREEGRKTPAREESRRAGPGFEQRLERLEQLAARLREGKIPLEEAVAVFEEGMRLSRALEKELARVERRVEILTREPGEEGQPDGEPGLELFPELGDEE
jgi:exodeoxyribonuclease VII small subunit